MMIRKGQALLCSRVRPRAVDRREFGGGLIAEISIPRCAERTKLRYRTVQFMQSGGAACGYPVPALRGYDFARTEYTTTHDD